MDKHQELNDFMNKWQDLPEQRSEQWFADRMFSVGASVMGVLGRCKDYYGNIVSANKYQSIRHLIREKCGLEPITDYTALNWGCIMEPVCTAFTSRVFECKIHEMGAIPNVECPLQRCSPDGVGVIEKMGNKIASFEFKCPIGRMPNGKVPIYYRAQVMACLCAVEPADIGIFVDVAVRNCSVDDWKYDNNRYNESCFEYTFPNGNKKKPSRFKKDDIEALIVGLIYDETKDTKVSEENISPIDYGSCNGDVFKELMDDCARKKTKRCEFSEIFMRGVDEPKIELPDGVIGFIPLKIMLAKIVPIEKKCGFVSNYVPLITTIINIVRDVVDLPIEERGQKIDELIDERNIMTLQHDIPLLE